MILFIILIYNNATNKFERYCLEPFDSMPYTHNNQLTVQRFLSGSFTSIAWTTTEFLDSLMDILNNHHGQLSISRCFRRICEGGHISESQHYAGIAMDFAQDIKALQRLKIYNILKSKKDFNYIDNLRHTRDHIHADTRPAHLKYGFPELTLGNCGVYVLVLQDALNTIGITGSALDGFFGNLTLSCVKSFQKSMRLRDTGYVDKQTWRLLANSAAGLGNTPSVLHMNN